MQTPPHPTPQLSEPSTEEASPVPTETGATDIKSMVPDTCKSSPLQESWYFEAQYRGMYFTLVKAVLPFQGVWKGLESVFRCVLNEKPALYPAAMLSLQASFTERLNSWVCYLLFCPQGGSYLRTLSPLVIILEDPRE